MKHFLPITLTLLLLAGGATARAQETNSASPAEQDPFLALERNNIFNQSRVPHDYRSGRVNRPRVETITLCGTAVDDCESNAVFQGSDNFFKAGQIIKGLKIVRITLDSVTLADTNDDTPTNSSSKAATTSGGSPATNSGSNTATNSGSNTVTNSGSNTVTNSGSNTVTNSGSNTVTNSGGNAPTISSGKAFLANSISNTFVLDMVTHPTLRREGDGPWRVSAYVAPPAAPATNSAATTTVATASGAKDNDIIAKLKKKREQEEK